MGAVTKGNRLIRYDNAAEHFDVPQHIEYIEDLAFADCDRLIRLEIPDSVKVIGNYAFSNCYSLREIRLPAAVRKTGSGLFQKCWNIRSVTLPEGMKTLGGDMFEGCHALAVLHLPSSIESVERTAFSTCRSLRKIYTEPERIGILPASARYQAVLTYMEEHVPEDGTDVIDKYVDGRNKSFLDLAINRRSTESVRYMLGRGLITADALSEYLVKSANTGRVEITALLLEYGKDNNTGGLSKDPFK